MSPLGFPQYHRFMQRLLQQVIISQKLGSRYFWQIANCVLNKDKSATQRCCLLHLIKQNCLLKTFLRTLILMTQLSLYLFSLLELISITPKMVKKVTMNLDLSKASGPDCIPVVVLKNCEPELSYILAKLINKCLNKFFFQIVGKSHRWSLYLRMLRKGLLLKTTALLVFFLWLVKSLINL